MNETVSTGRLYGGHCSVVNSSENQLGPLDAGVFVSPSRRAGRRRRDAPAPPRLPDYVEVERRPPAYNPGFLQQAPTIGHRCWSAAAAEGRHPSSSTSARRPPPPPPPPSRSSSCATAERHSVGVTAERCTAFPATDNDNDDDDDVFFTEKPTTTDFHELQTSR